MKEIEVIAFKPEFLKNLSEAMGGDFVQLRFKDAASAILVKTKNEEYQAVGVIMPIMWDSGKY